MMHSVCRCSIARAISRAVDTIAAMSRCPSVRVKPPRRRKSFKFPRSAISSTNRNCRGVEAAKSNKTSQNEKQFNKSEVVVSA